ncbi:MAG: hypothetical protein Q9157_000242 [Trypethelium eluteriae]
MHSKPQQKHKQARGRSMNSKESQEGKLRAQVEAWEREVSKASRNSRHRGRSRAHPTSRTLAPLHEDEVYTPKYEQDDFDDELNGYDHSRRPDEGLDEGSRHRSDSRSSKRSTSVEFQRSHSEDSKRSESRASSKRSTSIESRRSHPGDTKRSESRASSQRSHSRDTTSSRSRLAEEPEFEDETIDHGCNSEDQTGPPSFAIPITTDGPVSRNSSPVRSEAILRKSSAKNRSTVAPSQSRGCWKRPSRTAGHGSRRDSSRVRSEPSYTHDRGDRGRSTSKARSIAGENAEGMTFVDESRWNLPVVHGHSDERGRSSSRGHEYERHNTYDSGYMSGGESFGGEQEPDHGSDKGNEETEPETDQGNQQAEEDGFADDRP